MNKKCNEKIATNDKKSCKNSDKKAERTATRSNTMAKKRELL